MAVQLPTPSQLLDIADDIGLDLTESDVTSFLGLLGPTVAAYNVVDSMADNLPPVRYPRTPGYRPSGDENAYNAWYIKSTVHGAAEGKLKGKTVVLKDNVMLAGVPMMNGAATLEGYVPDIDATVVHRILDAGGTILGKAHCENLCLSGGSHTNATGPVVARRMCVILVEQHVELALRVASYVYVMERGTIALEGASAAVRDDPALLRFLAP